MFESELADILVSGAATLVYIAGLAGFVTWLKGRDVKAAATVAAIKL